MSILSRLFFASALLACAGCSSVYHLANQPNSTELSQAQKAALLAKKSAVPCRVDVICPSDMVGKYNTFFTSNVCHYPLEKILEQAFSNAVYSSFEQPGGEILDAFTLKVEVYKSQLLMSKTDATYTISLNITLEEPGEKKVITFNEEKTNFIPIKGNVKTEVPEAVYEVVKEAAVSALNKIKTDPKAIKTIKRFEKK